MKLTTAARNALPSSAFVFPAQRAYPIHDENHARDALARVAQNGSPSEKAKVRAAVKKRYPGIDSGRLRWRARQRGTDGEEADVISVDLPATLECDFEKGCTEALSVKLVLNAGGTLARGCLPATAGKIGVSQIGIFLTRCPQHHQLLEEPTAPRLGDLRIAKH